MDDLISREAALEVLGECPENWTDSPEEIEAVNSWCFAADVINSVPTVPAVPLEPLLEILDETETIAPCTLCRKIIPDWCEEHNKPPLIWDKKIDCPTWETLLTKWMEEQHDD